jgi:predicted PurR-regulated permease PerM
MSWPQSKGHAQSLYHSAPQSFLVAGGAPRPRCPMANIPKRAPTRTDQLLTLAGLGVLIVGCFLVLQPFLSAVIWAAILCATSWPLYERLRRRFRHEWIAPTIMLAIITIVLFAPFVVVGATIADNAEAVERWARALIAEGPPDPPSWVAELPLVGPSVASYWAGMAHDTAAVMNELRKYIEPARKFALASGATVAGALLQLALSIIVAFFIFRDAEAITGRLRGGIRRLAGERGAELGRVAIATVRGVVLGILGTAIVQGVLAGIGFWIAGIKAAPLLGFITFLLSPVPVGPPLVWIPAGLSLINAGQVGWGIFVLAWGGLVVSTIDNVIRPLIISAGSDLPFVLVLLGILGGVVAFGFIGVFLGPVLLALGYALLQEWATHQPTSNDEAADANRDE